MMQSHTAALMDEGAYLLSLVVQLLIDPQRLQ